MNEQALVQMEGTVQAVIFKNEENGYAVLHFLRENGDELVLTGVLPEAAPGEELNVAGFWVSHPSYGDQFSVVSFERRLPADEKGIYEYLASGVLKGVGKRTARRMVEQFGTDTFRILSEEPEKLTAVRGISPEKARALGESFRGKAALRLLTELFLKSGIPPQLAVGLYAAYGPPSLPMIRENPYLICAERWDGDFAAADRLAMAEGLSPESGRRLKEGLVYELLFNLQNGHTFIPAEKLVRAAARLLDVDEALLPPALDGLAEEGRIVREDICSEDAVYLSELYADEKIVAEQITARLSSGREPWLAKPDEIDRLLSREPFVCSDRQRQAVEQAARHSVFVLTGGPGTGKTTTVRSILALFDGCGLETVLAAPTGRAAKRMSELCGREAKTIHRLLEAAFMKADGMVAFGKNENNPIEADALIVDECSMLDIRLAASLLRALRPDTRIIFVGDPDQLPPVGPGNFLADLLKSGRVPAFRLTEIFRQAEESGIVLNAHRINEGRLPEPNNADFFVIGREGPKEIGKALLQLVDERIPARFRIERQEIQVLSPWRQREAGTLALNRMLADRLNPADPAKNEIRAGAQLFREGDRVMQMKNNYDIPWERAGGEENGRGAFNGDIGHIVCIDDETEEIIVLCDERIVRYPFSSATDLELAYAVTVHKAQGSEFDAVILALANGPPRMLTRSVLYTAVTRAKKLMVVVGSEDALAAMVKSKPQSTRYSALHQRIGL